MPQNTTHAEICCPVCSGTSCDFVKTLNAREQFREYAGDDAGLQEQLLEACELPAEGWDMYRCRSCGLHFCDPLQEPGAHWYTLAYNNLDLHASGRWEFDYIADRLAEGDRVGEIGCGTGIFLDMCRERGIAARGLDFADVSVDICRGKGLDAGLLSISSENEWELADRASRNVAVSCHVLEHLADPGGLLRLAYRWTGSDATLWISVPSDRRLHTLARLRDYLDEPPHHLTRWTPAALTRIGLDNGWDLQRVVYEPLRRRQGILGMCVNSTPYRLIRQIPGTGNRVIERLIRYALYPYTMLRHGGDVMRMSGFAMLAEYRKSAA